MHIDGIESCHFLRANAAAIPPAISPTAVAVMPIPITPSAFWQTLSALFTQIPLKLIQINAIMRVKMFKVSIPLAIRSSSVFFRTKACLQSGAICKKLKLRIKKQKTKRKQHLCRHKHKRPPDIGPLAACSLNIHHFCNIPQPEDKSSLSVVKASFYLPMMLQQRVFSSRKSKQILNKNMKIKIEDTYKFKSEFAHKGEAITCKRQWFI